MSPETGVRYRSGSPGCPARRASPGAGTRPPARQNSTRARTGPAAVRVPAPRVRPRAAKAILRSAPRDRAATRRAAQPAAASLDHPRPVQEIAEIFAGLALRGPGREQRIERFENRRLGKVLAIKP